MASLEVCWIEAAPLNQRIGIVEFVTVTYLAKSCYKVQFFIQVRFHLRAAIPRRFQFTSESLMMFLVIVATCTHECYFNLQLLHALCFCNRLDIAMRWAATQKARATVYTWSSCAPYSLGTKVQ